MKKLLLTSSKLLLFLYLQKTPAYAALTSPHLPLTFLHTPSAFRTTTDKENPVNLSGTIISAKGEPLPGVTVLFKGSTIGTTTNPEGLFNLSLPSTNGVLVISFIGYLTKEVTVNGQTNLKIALDEDAKALDEVVIVGYGTQKKSDLTGAVASIANLNVTLKQTPASSFEKALQGGTPGIQVTQSSGQPGTSATIRIRGGNSINGGNEPLYVIDGFPIYNDNREISAGALSGASINALSTINPNDIESIEVLKDASATAIYGSRGANGVVLITTKRGKIGENLISYETYAGTQEITRTLPVLNAPQWAQFKNDALVNSGKPALYTPEQIANLGQGTNWQKEAFRTAPVQNHQLTITGGDAKTRYAIAGNYFNQEGILLNSGFKRYSTRINLDQQVSPKLKVGASLTGSRVTSNIAEGNAVRYVLTMASTVPLIDPNTNDYTLQSPYGSLGNPVATLKYVTNQSIVNRALANFYGEYRIAEGLTAKVTLGTDIISSKQNNYYPRNTYTGAQTQGIGAVGSQFVTNWLNENTLHYNKVLNGIHALDAVLGYTFQQASSEGSVAKAQSLPNDDLGYTGLNAATVSSIPGISKSDWTLRSYLGRLNYSLHQKYLFTLTARADGSSRFGANNKWGFFPSAAVAWNVSEEGFIKDIQVISNLKVRTSIGATGNQQIGQYQSLAQLDPYNYIFGNALATGFAPSRIANPNLGWETTLQYDGGLDLGFFNDRITFTVDAYYKKTKDLLLDRPVSETSGFYTALQNVGTVENKGLEFLLNTQNTTGAFSWNTSVNFSLNRNKVLDLGGLNYFYPEGGSERNINKPTIVRVGEPIGQFYGYQTNGIFQTADDIVSLPTVDAKNTKPGDRRFVDQNGDGRITQDGDRVVIGQAQPKFLGGITNSFSYKNFDLTLLLQGVYGNSILNFNKVELETPTGFQQVSTDLLNRWTPTNPSNEVPRAVEVSALWLSNRFIEDGSYLRVKNLVFGYNLPASLLQKVHLKKLRVYVSGQNLYTFTKYSGYDPEVSRNEQSTLYSGIDYGNYPNFKTYTAGLQISF
ncbi:SusC/RagA family protein [Adhaeribacter arboris]|uniref:SusC/RagA family protein n=1 Tax=Adhaeribacter arboris TaxID=2072846 RepID=A0A2T2YLW0_9BACT|nr:TonB-dependent receptor [Adhaeribacter arboris]PSR56494.1 SusC/RagA family protein [Adhaeribacter arboris]